MANFQNRSFSSEEITVDGNQYTGCQFDNCVLIFEGGAVPRFDRCIFRSIKVQLKGSAAQTTQYLANLHRSGLPEAVETTLRDVESGLVLLPNPPQPPPALYTGDHYGRLAAIAVPIIAVFVWLFVIYVYGYIQQPLNTLAQGRPLVREAPESLIPVLPDTLAQAYDLSRDEQLAQITTFQWVDQAAGIARIPVEDAYAVLIAREAAR